MEQSLTQIIDENTRRNRLLTAPYDQLSGTGCCGRRVKAVSPGGEPVLVPQSMLDDPDMEAASRDERLWRLLRVRHDFEYWAATCVTVKDKLTGRDVKFMLNRPQRRVVALFEQQRCEGRPIRIIMLKARQWGGSTLVQMYMAWIQCCRARNWHSLICAHVKDVAATIRGIYTKMLDSYPGEFWDEEERPGFTAFERSINTRLIRGRDCRVTVASSERQESVRGADVAMAHLSEVAFWADTPSRTPEGFVRAICAGIARVPESLVVLESTANGVGNYFHSEWLRSKRGESDKAAVFVPWYEIDIYSVPVGDYGSLWMSLDTYERGLWERGCTLEQIAWYREKRREYPTAALMAAEFPSDDIEAFANTGHGVFTLDKVERLRASCTPPAAVGRLVTHSVKGPGALEIDGFCDDPNGRLKVWRFPEMSPLCRGRYVAAVDIGGRSEGSDYTVISVLDALGHEGRPAVVAQWRGHGDHDIVAWTAASIAQWYCEALLVIESNSLESSCTGGEHGLYVLSELNHVYRNLYRRRINDSVAAGYETRVGFHTNRATKTMLINHLIAMVRDEAYIERDSDACDELAVYECDPSGRFGARAGYHDDILMTRAIALYAASQYPPVISERVRFRRKYRF
ncbi:MAG: hypothetical protein K1V87_05510 [Muribaculum sp.]